MKTFSATLPHFTLCIFFLFGFQNGVAQSFGGESVEYDSVGNRFFSSSDGSSIVQRASNGTISYFGSGLDADYGMEVMGNNLFVIGGGQIRGYDLTTAQQVMSLSIPGASFLNGMTSNGTNKLWVTAFSNDKIFEVDVTSLAFAFATEIVANTVSTPNGIVYDGPNNRLVFVGWGSNAPIKAVDLGTNQVTTLVTTNLGNIDGIDEDSQGNFYISSWSPDRISKYDNAFANPPVTITAPGVNNPADICYAKAIDTLAIPNGNGTVTFVGFTPPVALEDPMDQFGLHLSPNPVTESSWIGFELEAITQTKISIFNTKGQLQQVLLEDQLPAGTNQVLLTDTRLPAGTYFLVLEANGERVSRRFVKLK